MDKNLFIAYVFLYESEQQGEWRYSSTISYLATRHRWAAQPDSLHGRSIIGGRVPNTWWIEGWVDHTLTVTLGRRNVTCPCQQQQCNSLAVQPTLQSLTQQSVRREMTVATMCLRIQVFRSPKFSVNVYVMPNVPSSLVSTFNSKRVIQTEILGLTFHQTWNKNCDHTVICLSGLAMS
jgi:hypothetical protein